MFTTATRLCLALAFLFATGPDVFGIHECPYHDHAEGRGLAHGASADPVGSDRPARSDDGAEGGSDHEHGASERVADGHETSHPDGPCTWLVDCHASVESSPYAPVASAPMSVPGVEGPFLQASMRPQLHGPRHLLRELHLPNAPPLRI